jgi:sec-independent protein translocase protein TatC
MKVAFVASIFVTVPLSLYEVWKFIAPGLYRHEKRYVVPFFVSSILLFLAGGAFCYVYVLPQAYGFLIGFGWIGRIGCRCAVVPPVSPLPIAADKE